MKYKLILSITVITLSACSTTATTDMSFFDKSPRGIKITNVSKALDSKAYQSAEIHCAKYLKVPRILKKQKISQDYEELKTTIAFECIRP